MWLLPVTFPLLYELHERLQALLHYFVVVAAIGVGAQLRRIGMRLLRWCVVVGRRDAFDLVGIQSDAERLAAFQTILPERCLFTQVTRGLLYPTVQGPLEGHHSKEMESTE